MTSVLDAGGTGMFDHEVIRPWLEKCSTVCILNRVHCVLVPSNVQDRTEEGTMRRCHSLPFKGA